MPRKRIRSKIKNTINLRSLTFDLYESACGSMISKNSMGDLFRKAKKWRAGIGDYDSLNGWLFDKNDPEICKQIWNRHGEAIMARWRSNKDHDGYTPWLFDEIQRIEKLEKENR